LTWQANGVGIDDSVLGGVIESETNSLVGNCVGRSSDFGSTSAKRVASDLSCRGGSGGSVLGGGIGVCESAKGLACVQTAALESLSGDGHWLSSVDEAESWGNAVDDGSVVEVSGLEDGIVDASLVGTTPSDDESGVEQPSIGGSSHDDLGIANADRGTLSSSEHNLHVGGLSVELRISEERTGDGDLVSLPAEVGERSGDHWTMSEWWASDDLGLFVPPHGDGLVVQADVCLNAIDDDGAIGWGGDGDVDSVEEHVWGGVVEPDVIGKTDTREGHRESVVRVQITARWGHQLAQRSIVISWSPNLEVESLRSWWDGGI